MAGDTLKTVSGDNHSGCMTITKVNDQLKMTAFEQTADGAGFTASAKRIFGTHYDIFQNMNSNQNVRVAARKEQLKEYAKQQQLNIRFYQDYGWPAVEL